LKTDAEDNQNDNVYVRTALQLKVLEKIDSIFATEMEGILILTNSDY